MCFGIDFFGFFVLGGFPGGSVVKNLPTNAGGTGDADLTPWVGKIPWRRKWQPLQYSCLENPMDRGPWWDEFYGVKKNWAFQFVNTSNFIFPVFFHMFSLVVSAVD